MADEDPSLPEVLSINGKRDGKPYGVIVPCSTEAFGEFISGLLGQPQTISTNINGAYVVDRKGIENIFNLVQQRVLQQNDSVLIQWTITLMYDDNATVRLGSYDDFSRYA